MSSACYVYAIVDRDTPLPAAHIAGHVCELTTVSYRDLAAVTRYVESEPAPLTRETVLHHEAVVEAVRRQGPALPVRFGTVFRDAVSVASALAGQYESLAADLARVGDKVELGLTALWAGPPGEPSPQTSWQEKTHSAGARYLHARAAELRRDEALKEVAEALARDLDEVLGGLALEQRVSLLPTPRVAVRAAYLLNPAAVGGFRAAFEGFRARRLGLRVLLTGPWPPYSFVKRKAESAADMPGVFQLITDAIQGAPRLSGRGV